MPEGRLVWRHGVSGEWLDREISITRLTADEAATQQKAAEQAVLAADRASEEQAADRPASNSAMRPKQPACLVVGGFPKTEVWSDFFSIMLDMSTYNGEYYPSQQPIDIQISSSGRTVFDRPIWTNASGRMQVKECTSQKSPSVSATHGPSSQTF